MTHRPPPGIPRLLLGALLGAALVVSCTGRTAAPPAAPKRPGLVAARATMATAWTIPMDPTTDSTLAASPWADQVRRGFRLFTNTGDEASRYALNGMTCNNCHLNAGQKDLALPLVGVAAGFPEYNKRAGRLFSLEDRVLGCFMRSMDATDRDSLGRPAALPANDDPEVLALSAYLTWLSADTPVGTSPPWRKRNRVDPDSLLPMERLDPGRGRALFLEKCVNCHGEDGQGAWIGDRKAGPLWGPRSWNDGAGAARVYTLAGMIRWMMPYMDPGSLSDGEAQHIAAYIDSRERPPYAHKDRDYLTEPLPVDAVYYPKR